MGLMPLYETPWASFVAQLVKSLPAVQETQVQSLGEEDPLEKKTAPTPVFLPRKSHGQRGLVLYYPRGRKESDRTTVRPHRAPLLFHHVTAQGKDTVSEPGETTSAGALILDF